MKIKTYASTETVSTGKGDIVIGFYGPRGRTVSTAEITLAQAQRLICSLQRAIAESADMTCRRSKSQQAR
jgi:hypothetical protein